VLKAAMGIFRLKFHHIPWILFLYDDIAVVVGSREISGWEQKGMRDIFILTEKWQVAREEE
jgi:hypothetical protein